MACNLGPQDENMTKMDQITDFLLKHGFKSFILMGDSNMEPAELPRRWLVALNATVLTAGGSPTCPRTGRVLDYFIVSDNLVPAVASVSLVTEAPGGPTQRSSWRCAEGSERP